MEKRYSENPEVYVYVGEYDVSIEYYQIYDREKPVPSAAGYAADIRQPDIGFWGSNDLIFSYIYNLFKV